MSIHDQRAFLERACHFSQQDLAGHDPQACELGNGFLPCSTDSRHSPCFSCLTVSQVFTHHSAFGGSTAWGRILKNQRSEIYKQASHPAWALSKALVAIVEVEILQVERMVYIGFPHLSTLHCEARSQRLGDPVQEVLTHSMPRGRQRHPEHRSYAAQLIAVSSPASHTLAMVFWMIAEEMELLRVNT